MFRLFGTPQIYFEGEWQHLAKNQLTLLAAYLAFSKDWVSRDEVIFKFWPDVPEVKARRNLNQLAYQLKKEAWAEGLESTATHLRFNVSSDLELFREAITEAKWSEASRLYKAELLSGLYRNVSANFETWLEAERQSLDAIWQDATLTYAKALDVKGQYHFVLELLEDILVRNPLAEDVLQFYLVTAVKAEQLQQAIQMFERFQTELTTRLDLQPPDLQLSDKTLHLVEQIKSDLASGTSHSATGEEALEYNKVFGVPSFNVPQYSSAFVGREAEVAKLGGFFKQSDSRLITIIGWGGMGKTRLAVKAMLEHQTMFRDGVAFIALQSLSNETDIIQEITRVLELKLQNTINIKQQLFSYIADKHLLLLFDNFEHLVEDSAIVSELLQYSANLRILTTSREALNYQGEQLLELQGLSFPEHIGEEDFEQHDSVELFLRIARRTGSFKYSPEDRQVLLKICQFLEGMPLAIELAGQWCRLLSLPEILKELQRDLDFLEGQQKDRPDRQQSMRKVFIYSWQLLSEDEQQAMLKLAILEGAFPKEAAQAIGEVSLRSLFSLINKSILKQEHGFLTRHPLVYEFTLEKLLNSDQFETLQHRHSEYYTDFANNLNKGDAQELVNLHRSHQNIVAAVNYLHLNKPEKALRFLLDLQEYWELRASYQEVSNWLIAILDIYNKQDELQAESCLLLAKHLVWQSVWEPALEKLNESYALAEQLGLSEVKADALHSLGQLHFFQSKYTEAKAYYEQSLVLYRQLDHEKGIAQSLNSLGVIAKDQGHYKLATEHYQESLKIRKRLQDHYGIATALNNLGIIAKDQGDYERAIDLYQQSLSLREELQDQRGTAQCLLNIGLIEINRENYPQAKESLEKSLAIEQTIGNIYGESLCLNTLANLAIDQKLFEEAEELANEGLKLKVRLDDQRGIAFSKHSIAFLHREQDNYSYAANYFKQSLSMFQAISDQRGCLLVIADSIILFVLTNNPKSYSYFKSCEKLCKNLNISIAPRTWNKTQNSIQVFKKKQWSNVVVNVVTLNDLIYDCESELELLMQKT